jgi:two-component system cell cycle response regulator
VKARALRRALHVSGGAIAMGAACALVAAGALDNAAQHTPSPLSVMLLAGVAVLVVAAVARRLGFETPTARAQRTSFWLARATALADAEMALALVLGCAALLAATGGARSPAYPLLYGVVAFSVTFQGRAGAWTTVIAALVVEGGSLARGPFDSDAAVAAACHAGFICGAAAAHAVFLRGLVFRQRREHRRRLAEEIRAQRESARDYRLVAAALGAESRAGRNRIQEEHMLAAGGVQVIGASVYHNLRLLKRSLQASTCALLWYDERGDSLKIKELVSDSDDVTEKREVRASGALGAIVHKRAPLLLPSPKPGQVPYVESDAPPQAFAGVPVLEGPHLRGVLCANRGAAFEERDLELLSGAAEQSLRALQAERVFRSVERSKYEHERFYNASAMLCQALTLEQVMDTAFAAAAQIVDHDVAAIALYDRDRNRHRVYSVRVRPGAEYMVDAVKLQGLEYRPNSGLAAMVVKNKHYLPAGGEPRDPATPIYTKRIKIRDFESLLVLPLLSADEAIGTFMLASQHPQRFRKDVREMLGVIANQVAVSLQNAMMYKKMETMATTDGLTGLTNHKTFQERFEHLLERAERLGHRAAILLCDVDHFKKVNDKYGHPVGDQVLRRVARVLQNAVRKIDITARYGGEEFAVVLEATTLAGATQLAERIRKDVSALILDSEQGAFRINLSIGVAAFPTDARLRADLVERADLALYHAKETGRNRVVTYQQFVDARKARKAS